MIEHYFPGKTSIREAARSAGVSNHRMKRALISAGVEILRAPTQPFTESHKQALRGKRPWAKCWSRGKKMSADFRLKNAISHSRFDVSYEWASQFDLDVFMAINKAITPRSGRWSITSDDYRMIVEKFGRCSTVRRIVQRWLASGRNKYLALSFDHIKPTCRGGGCGIENIQPMTWFENRCKNDMTQEEWIRLKANISDYFS
jgi:hypothetical protein